jgi:hypothetical protein
VPSADVRGAGPVRRAEHAAFHLGPRSALPVTAAAVRWADERADPARGLLAWCHGACLGAAGEYGAAFALLDRTPAGGPAGARLLSLRGSLLRQLGRHGEAQSLDAAVLADADAEPVGRADAAVGLVADAIGVADVVTATAALDRASRLLDAGTAAAVAPPEHGWRLAVRREWVAAELALLVEQPAQAATHARRAARLAAAEGADRHLAKSRLLIGVAAQDPEALRACLAWARAAGCVSLRWPAALVLAHLPCAEPRGTGPAPALLAEAAAGVGAIADGLATGDRARWLARPEVAALLAGGKEAGGRPG